MIFRILIAAIMFVATNASAQSPTSMNFTQAAQQMVNLCRLEAKGEIDALNVRIIELKKLCGEPCKTKADDALK